MAWNVSSGNTRDLVGVALRQTTTRAGKNEDGPNHECTAFRTMTAALMDELHIPSDHLVAVSRGGACAHMIKAAELGRDRDGH